MMDHRCRHFRDQASQFQWWLHTWCLRAEKVSQGDVNRRYIRNTAQTIFASLSHDHKYHLNGLAIGRACHFPICSRTWPPSVAWHFPNAQWGPNLHENYGPPGLLASPGHGKGLWSLCFVPCWTWTPPSANSPPSPTVAAGRKKILIYGESMVNLYGESLWWISMVNLWQFWWDDDFHRWVLGAPHWTQPGGKHKWPWRIAIVSDLLFNFVQDWEMSRKYEMYNKLWMITGFKHKFVHPVPNQQRYFLGSWSAQTPIK